MGATAGATAGAGWTGIGGASMMATAIPYVAALEGLAAWVQQSGASAAAIEQAYATARAAMVQVPVCTTNRTTQAGLVATNIIGQNTPAIIGLDTEYFGHFWTQNASSMGSYEAIVTTIITALSTPPPPAPLTANPAGPAGQAAAIAQAAGSGAASAAMSQSMQGVTEASSAVQPVAQTAAAPASAAQSLAPQMLSQLGQLPQMLGRSRCSPVPADARPVPADGDGHARTAGQRYERERSERRGPGQGVRGCQNSGAGIDDGRRRARGWWRRSGLRRHCRGDVQLHPAHRQLQRSRAAEAAYRLDTRSRNGPAGRVVGATRGGRRRRPVRSAAAGHGT